MSKRKTKAAAKEDAKATADESESEQRYNDEFATKKRRRGTCTIHVPSSMISAGNGSAPRYYKLPALQGDLDIDASSNQATTGICIKDLVIHVPRGHKGRLMLELDLSSSLHASPGSVQLPSFTPHDVGVDPFRSDVVVPQSTTYTAPSLSTSADESRCGFLKLPVELHNIIYSEIFVTKHGRYILPFSPRRFWTFGSVSPHVPTSSPRGNKVALLENKFYICRDWRSRGGYWERKWADLGYETMHVFFKTIGTANRLLLRSVQLHLHDATTTAMPNYTPEERRYIYDQDLIGILDHLAENTQLQLLKINIDGRKKVAGGLYELDFFDHLAKVKASQVELKGPGDSEPMKIDSFTLDFLRKAMQREEPEDEGMIRGSSYEALRPELKGI